MRLWLLALALAGPALAQTATVAGTVRDGDGHALAGASVYLSGTTRGAASGPGGRFEIAGVPPGAYRLVGSLVGFAPDARALELAPGQRAEVDLVLAEAVSELGPVRVEAGRDRRWERRLARFQRVLLGESENADSTRILNPEVLSFRQRWGALHAEAAAPLVVENRALGYRLVYDLTRFRASPTYVDYDGDERFEALVPADSAEAERWRAARARAWRGSLMHLLQSLLAGTAEAEGYSFVEVRQDVSGLRSSRPRPGRYVLDLEDDGWGRLRVWGRLEVTYAGEPEEPRYLTSDWFHEQRSRPDRVQRSALHLDGTSARIDPQGTPEDPFAVSTSGHMAFERLADRVPEDYRPPADDAPGGR